MIQNKNFYVCQFCKCVTEQRNNCKRFGNQCDNCCCVQRNYSVGHSIDPPCLGHPHLQQVLKGFSKSDVLLSARQTCQVTTRIDHSSDANLSDKDVLKPSSDSWITLPQVPRRKITVNDSKFTCDKCPFVAKYKQHFEYHMYTHSGVKPFKCDNCNYKCITKFMLASHMISHSDIFYRCSFCNYQTKYSPTFKNHLRQHMQGKTLNNNCSIKKKIDYLSTSSSLNYNEKQSCEQLEQPFTFCEDLPSITFNEKPISVNID